jgi:cysteine synthase
MPNADPDEELHVEPNGRASILDLVGRTPVVEAPGLMRLTTSRLFLKLEEHNPSGSIKDRAAVEIVRDAERTHRLPPGGTIIESTSGNFGKALALIGAARGYPVVLVMDAKTPATSLRYCSALGARIELVDASPADNPQAARLTRTRELTHQLDGAFWANQYGNPANPRVHQEVTAAELPPQVGEFDTLVAAVSTGGHLTGIGRYLKQHDLAVDVVGVDAWGSTAFGGEFAPYRMRGIGLSWSPENLDRSVINHVHHVTDLEAFSTCRALARSDGIAVGESGGAVVFASLAFAARHPQRRIVAVIADGADAYLDGGVYDDSWLDAVCSGAISAGADDVMAMAEQPTHPSGAPEPHLAKHERT